MATTQQIINAWTKARLVNGSNPALVRIDSYGSIIAWSEYGLQTQYGWEIDHELPESQFPGLAKQPENLRALHWRNNRAKSDKIDIATILKIARGNQ